MRRVLAIFFTLAAVGAQTLANYALRGERYGPGIALLAGHFFLWCLALRLAPLTLLIPWTALSHVLNAFLARKILRERVTRRRWAGTLLIALGIVLCN
ncbi:MAG: EamA family transporter [Candidatus Eremiobacteraeota bacterium]|nr:EamA family transporter [Candidatus Eremiobacteraeota bacterium]MCW5872903.1 EamA family transporter [Candidatus Eremiobacteraeota bacterium]